MPGIIDMSMDIEHLTAPEVEAYAAGVWDCMLMLGMQDGHGKTYDPLTIETTHVSGREPIIVAHTYVFDLWDGGRHHECKSLAQLLAGIRWEFAEFAQGGPDGWYDPESSYIAWAKEQAETHGAIRRG